MLAVVTGADGFLGRPLTQALIKSGYTVISVSRVPDVKKNKYPNTSVLSYQDLPKLSGLNIDILCHLAWPSLTNFHSDEHLAFSEHSLQLITQVVKNNNLKKIFIPGTNLEYGMLEGCLNAELTNLRPTTAYGIAKLKLMNAVFDQFDKNLKIFWGRIFYIYGQNQSEKTLYGSLLKSIRNNDEYFPMSHGNQIRDFILIDDAIELITEKCSSSSSLVFNVCSGNGIRVREFVEKVCKVHGSDIKLLTGVLSVPDYEAKNFWGHL